MRELKDQIKIAAFDVDGTILPYGNTSFGNKTIEMFSLLKDAGYKTVISSAREFSTIGNFLEVLKPDYFIGANGSFIYDVEKDSVLEEHSLKSEDVSNIVSNFLDKVVGFVVTHGKFSYYTQGVELNSWFVKPNIQNYKELNLEELKNSQDKTYLITVTSENPKEDAKHFQEYIENNNLDMVVNSVWTHGFFIAPQGVTKSSTLKNLTEKLGLSMDNLIAFGDSSNDYEMLRDAFYGVAMERASQRIKSVANDVALDCEYDGAYLKLKELKLI
ncbi:YcsE-related riboflavin metabolism phosphatase [Mycoplasma sp. Ms02]|uniref:YcsE-related riboflavin metabolism phosphatase n=1 Tax=Mycoplasma sp. Ms02 TaxID=353851 RepID=UPI001C8A303A|nr:HAD family hydrolase [Mycoplasma sp. Ms02]QZE12092.1 Cof-type HAD-IIB family hydrolase [Mycoplasma sp. Ms02]